jgi:hypothetical protein
VALDLRVMSDRFCLWLTGTGLNQFSGIFVAAIASNINSSSNNFMGNASFCRGLTGSCQLFRLLWCGQVPRSSVQGPQKRQAVSCGSAFPSPPTSLKSARAFYPTGPTAKHNSKTFCSQCAAAETVLNICRGSSPPQYDKTKLGYGSTTWMTTLLPLILEHNDRHFVASLPSPI